jgi:CDP-glucose 4,6-dehydratase
MTLAEQIRMALDEQDLQRATQLCSPFNFGPHVTSNRTVKELVEALLQYWPGKWIDASDPDAHHEAGKLNLSSDKAFHLLNWLPRWGFEQAIEKTVEWYKFDEAQQQESSAVEKLIDFTRSQIQMYMQAS